MKIPEKIEMMGQEITVSYDDEYCKNRNSLGEADYDHERIILCSGFDGKPLPQDKINHVFWHEVVHHSLSKLGYDKLRKDESFVDAFSGVLYQVLKQVIKEK